MSIFPGFGQVVTVYPGLENFSWGIVEVGEVILFIFNLLDINFGDIIDCEGVGNRWKSVILRSQFV
jgi:hypothetical protein